jgi:glycosyltransferase involved in cell wall biosynthesis
VDGGESQEVKAAAVAARSDDAGSPSPALSIVVNNYNYARFLRDAIDSALAQTALGVEVIVVDDGSTDGSVEIIRSYGDRITPVFKPNGGQASALNAGYRVSRAPLVLFLDADDVLDATAAEAVIAAWRPGVAKVHFALRAIDEAGTPLGRLVPPGGLPSGRLVERIRRGGPPPGPPTSGNAFARDVLDRLSPIPEREWELADQYLLLLAPLLGEVAAIDAPLGGYRIHAKNRWSVQALNADRLHEYLDYDRRKVRIFLDRGRELGVEIDEDWLDHSPNHLQARLASLRLDPARHPARGDSRLRLLRLGVAASLADPWSSPRKRALFALWFVAAGALPRALSLKAIEMGYLAPRRPAWLAALLGGNESTVDSPVAQGNA